MKQIVKNLVPQNQVRVDDLVPSNSKFYGVVGNISGRKGMIVRRDYGRDDYEVRQFDELTGGNKLGYREDSLKNLINRLVNDHSQVFEFDNAKEFLGWLMED